MFIKSKILFISINTKDYKTKGRERVRGRERCREREREREIAYRALIISFNPDGFCG